MTAEARRKKLRPRILLAPCGFKESLSVAELIENMARGVKAAADAVTRMQVKADGAESSQRELAASNRGLVDDLQATRERLAVSQQEAMQFKAEAQTLRALLERLSPPEQVPPQGASASKTVKSGPRKAR